MTSLLTLPATPDMSLRGGYNFEGLTLGQSFNPGIPQVKELARLGYRVDSERQQMAGDPLLLDNDLSPSSFDCTIVLIHEEGILKEVEWIVAKQVLNDEEAGQVAEAIEKLFIGTLSHPSVIFPLNLPAADLGQTTIPKVISATYWSSELLNRQRPEITNRMDHFLKVIERLNHSGAVSMITVVGNVVSGSLILSRSDALQIVPGRMLGSFWNRR